MSSGFGARRGGSGFNWRGSPGRHFVNLVTVAAVLLGSALVLAIVGYNLCLLEVPTNSQAVLISKRGLDLEPDMEIAPDDPNGPLYKGVQPRVLTEGRYFYNPLFWDWEIYPKADIPKGKIGVRIRLVGEELNSTENQVLADPGQKGIQRGVLEPGLYTYNRYLEEIQQFDPVMIPAGFRGVVTNLAGPLPKDANVVLVAKGERGVQQETLPPGTHYLNPYEYRVSLVDCRSQRYNLSEGDPMDFLSADGFPVEIDGTIEFRVLEDKAAEIFVLYNEDYNQDEIAEELVKKIIMPESRSICRINGSKLTGGAFISGIEREQFVRDLERSLKTNCLRQGIEVRAVTVSTIIPPLDIAEPIQQREVAKQRLAQYQQERLQQESEAQLKVEELKGEQSRKLVEAEQEIVELTTKAEQDQAVALTQANQQLEVAKIKLEAARDQAAKLIAEAEAAAAVTRFRNNAEVAGVRTKVQAFGGDGDGYARSVLASKLAPAFKTILTNTEGPIMELFAQFTNAAPTSLGSVALPTSTAALSEAESTSPPNQPAPVSPAETPSASDNPPPANLPANPSPTPNPNAASIPNAKPAGGDQ